MPALNLLGKKMLFRCLIMLNLVLLTGFADPTPALAQSGCPQIQGKTIRWIVPFSPGGGYDTYSRLLAPYYAEALGAKIRVENISGGGGLVGIRHIAEAKPDGLTLGLINSPGTITASVSGVKRVPDPAKDLTIMGRMAYGLNVLVTGADSTLKSMDDVFALSARKPVVIGITGVGGINFLAVSMSSHLLGLSTKYVAGYRGTRQSSLAAMRGEVDLVSLPYDSALDRLQSGELRALLQIAAKPISQDPILSGVPLLAGPDGLAARRAAQLGRDSAEAAADSNALIALIQSGRLVVGPAGLDPKLRDCLREKLMQALADEGFNRAAAKANRPLHPASAGQAHQAVELAMQKAAKFAPIIREAIEKVRK